MRICVIFNPTARGEKAKRFHRRLLDIGSECSLKPTWAPGIGRQLATEAVGEGFDTIVAAGGDGTVNEVLNGLGDAPDGFERCRLGVIPLGTVNVFAKELGLPERLLPAWQAIKSGGARHVDAGVAESLDSSGAACRRYFIQMGGAGLDSRSIAMVDWELKKKLSQIAYILAGFKAMKGPHPRIEVHAEGNKISGELVLIGNGRFYGGRLPIFSKATLTDGLLDVCVFRQVNWSTVMRYAIGFLSGRVLAPEDLAYLQTRSFTLSSQPDVPFELEGDNVGFLPATFSVDPKRVRIAIAR